MLNLAQRRALQFTKTVDEPLSGPMLATFAVVSTVLIASILTSRATESQRSGLACLLIAFAIGSIAECAAMAVAQPRSLQGWLLTASDGIVGTFMLGYAIALNGGGVVLTNGWFEAALIPAASAMVFKMSWQIIGRIRERGTGYD